MKMNTHLRFGYLFVVLFGLLVVSCHSTPDTVVLSLSQAERIMESDPDSAMTILKHIPTPESLHGKAQADYSLLMTQAMDKNYMKFTSDSLIKFAVGYYRRQKLFDAALNDYRLSFVYYSGISDSLCMTYANRNIGRAFLYKNQIDSAYYYYDKALYISSQKEYSAVGSILLELGVIHRSQGDYVGAEYYFLSFLKKEKDQEKLYSGYLALGNLYLYMGRLKDAEMYLALCLENSKERCL